MDFKQVLPWTVATTILVLVVYFGFFNENLSLKEPPKVRSETYSLNADLERRIKEIVLKTILERPEIVREASLILEMKEKSAQTKLGLESIQNDLSKGDNTPILGNPKGDVTIIEFLDYNCGYCKRAAKIVKKIIDRDPQVRVALYELPILSKNSIFAASAALAAREQKKYKELHWALMDLGKVNRSTTLNAAKQIGLDINKLTKDMQSQRVKLHISKSMNIAKALGIRGTPTFIIGNVIKPGLVTLDELVRIVKQMRSKAL
ncbi:MAG: DsbA family protein [Pseudomonadota bacterium]|nr:DsbA family protein [Pseudomonadota bacterium]